MVLEQHVRPLVQNKLLLCIETEGPVNIRMTGISTYGCDPLCLRGRKMAPRILRNYFLFTLSSLIDENQAAFAHTSLGLSSTSREWGNSLRLLPQLNPFPRHAVAHPLSSTRVDWVTARMAATLKPGTTFIFAKWRIPHKMLSVCTLLVCLEEASPCC